MGKVIFRQDSEQTYLERPTHQATLESQVWVPFFWSVITSLTIMAGALLLIDAGLPIKVVPWVGLGTFLTAWLWFSWFLRNLLSFVEPFVDKDLNRDGVIGPKTTLRVELKNGNRLQYFDPDLFDFASDDAFVAFCHKLLATESLTEATWGKDYKAFPRGIGQFRNTRTLLEQHGYIEKAGNTWEPTDALLEVCERVLQERGYREVRAFRAGD